MKLLVIFMLAFSVGALACGESKKSASTDSDTQTKETASTKSSDEEANG